MWKVLNMFKKWGRREIRENPTRGARVNYTESADKKAWRVQPLCGDGEYLLVMSLERDGEQKSTIAPVHDDRDEAYD